MQMFYEKEICKTGIMVEHPVEDIIERVGCQFYTKVSWSCGGLLAVMDQGAEPRWVICDSTQEDDHKLANGIPDGRSVSPRPQITSR